MTEKQRFEYDYKTGRIYDNESDWQGTKNPLHWVTRLNNFDEQCKKLKGENEKLKQDLSEYCNFSLHDVLDKKNKEIEQLKKSKKGQELEIVRLHHLADAMSGVLRELGIYDVYNQEQINKVKKELQE